MNKILIICGPTATGKTSLGLYFAKKLNGEILSADSRQVYKGMDIITGKDLPEDRRIWLTDLVEPNGNFSVAQWSKAAWKVINSLWEKGSLPIVVGGTGLYIKALVDGIETINIPQNKKLRAQLSEKSVSELYDVLAQLDSSKAASMNRSDRRNPRRLIRAIEVADWKTENRQQKADIENKKKLADVLMIGLTAPRGVLYKKVDRRVERRLKLGALEEVKGLLKKGISWNDQAMTGLGYRQLEGYFEKEMPLEKVKEKWEKAEHEYARRQMTWFRKEKRIKWFSLTEKNWKREVEKLVLNWYDRK